MTADTAQKLLLIRDALALNNYDEAHHQLYAIACPDFDQCEPWLELERIAKSGSQDTTQVRNALSRRFPRLTFAVSETAWRHGGACIESYVEYVISVQPGFNGCDSQNFSDNSLEKCLVKFNAVAGK